MQNSKTIELIVIEDAAINKEETNVEIDLMNLEDNDESNDGDVIMKEEWAILDEKLASFGKKLARFGDDIMIIDNEYLEDNAEENTESINKEENNVEIDSKIVSNEKSDDDIIEIDLIDNEEDSKIVSNEKSDDDIIEIAFIDNEESNESNEEQFEFIDFMKFNISSEALEDNEGSVVLRRFVNWLIKSNKNKEELKEEVNRSIYNIPIYSSKDINNKISSMELIAVIEFMQFLNGLITSDKTKKEVKEEVNRQKEKVIEKMTDFLSMIEVIAAIRSSLDEEKMKREESNKKR